MVTLVDPIVKSRWEKEAKKGTNKSYPNIDLVRLEKWFFKTLFNSDNTKWILFKSPNKEITLIIIA